MFGVLHPALLGGLSLIAVPVIIHLLLRKRPRPRPWAAMRWLLAAARKAQRRYRLTNFLLLLCRCLIVAIIALMVMRPSLAGIGGGSRLTLVVDRSASMAARGTDPGPLAAAKAALARASLAYREVVVVAVDARVDIAASGSPHAAAEAIAGLEASELPGGLDSAARAPLAADLLAACGQGSDVVLISDFQQDDGAALATLLAPTSRMVSRWRVGDPGPNAVVAGVNGMGEISPASSGELRVIVAGAATGVALAVDGGPFVPSASATATQEDASVRVPLPPLPEGEHRLRVRISDQGLAYDNMLELPVSVRPRIAALAVQDAQDYLGAALAADERAITTTTVKPAQFAEQQLPERGVVALRAPIAQGARLRDWVVKGGILWAHLALLRGDGALKDLVVDVTGDGSTVSGGTYASGDRDIDEVLGIAARDPVPAATLPASAEILLRAGKAPVVIALPAGRGWVVVELIDLAQDRDLQARGTTPMWVDRCVRRLASRLDSPRFWQAGASAPADATLKRAGESLTVRAGETLSAAPGAWEADGGTVVVLPSREEGRLERTAATGSVASLDAALPRASGADLGLPLAVLALLAAIGEGLFAAWAGRTYGH
ncbi:MAG: BatA domain-containing protein [Planctomycetes bacterium]|nr:BatA domain-containing protein [Planctomycetota bacterium]